MEARLSEWGSKIDNIVNIVEDGAGELLAQR